MSDTARSNEEIILASGSASRRRMLEAAGINFAVEKPAVDEDEMKLALKGQGASAMQAAETLGELKAQRISLRHAGALVIGSDQMLSCEGKWFDKPEDLVGAKATLQALQGRSHQLETSVSVVLNGERIWHHNAVARLTMRPLGADFIDHYIERVGERALESVGAYQLEGYGVNLFNRVEGDFFVVLGLPLLPLLDFLRNRGAIPG